MSKVNNLIEVRSDGLVITPSMDSADIFALGEPKPVTLAKWFAGGREVSIRAPEGLLVEVVPGGDWVAAILNSWPPAGDRRLVIFDPMAEPVHTLDNLIMVGGSPQDGTYRWFEMKQAKKNELVAVFETAKHGIQYLVTVSAAEGRILRLEEAR